MAGFLDFLNSAEAQAGLGLLAAGGARADGANFGQRMIEGLGQGDKWKAQQAAIKRAEMQDQMAQMQMQQAQQQMAQQQKMQGLVQQFGRPAVGMAADGFGPSAPASFDRKGYGAALEALDPIAGMQYMQSIQKQAPKLTAYKPGDSVRDDSGREVFSIPKEQNLPSAIQEYEYAKQQGETAPFTQWMQNQKKAGATNVSTKIENKMGEGLAAQVGPMVKDTYTAAQGAVQQIDAAKRIVDAVDSGKVIAGPLAGGRLKVAQIGQMLGVNGKDEAETIANTRQVIRGLSEMTLQGRKQMTGQGAITESEGKLAEKANSGDIADLTPSEIRQLANASARAARFVYGVHQQNLQELQSDPNTAGLSKFYRPAPLPNFNFEQAAPAAPSGGGWSITPVGK